VLSRRARARLPQVTNSSRTTTTTTAAPLTRSTTGVMPRGESSTVSGTQTSITALTTSTARSRSTGDRSRPVVPVDSAAPRASSTEESTQDATSHPAGTGR
jgi:hypothetical protein